MLRRTILKTLSIAILLVLLLSLTTLAQENGGMHDSSGTQVTDSGFNALGDFSSVAAGPSLEPNILPPSMLARADYQKVYDEANDLYEEAASFRQQNLQLLPCTNVENCLSTYKNFSAGRLFYRFCASFEPQAASAPNIQLNGNQSCVPWNTLSATDQQARVADLDQNVLEEPKDIRNKLIRARAMFGVLAMAEPADMAIAEGSIRLLGRNGALAATRELANIHLIFGNEFMADALDYRFSGSDPRADAILAQEISQLQSALSQFTMAVDVLAYAFNANLGGPTGTYIGDFFTKQEYELFGIVSERMGVTLSEIANRYRQLGRDQAALDLYAKAFTEQYVQALALADSAAKHNENFLQNGGWRLMNNLEQLRVQAQAIHSGLNPFGFDSQYVPLQTYTEMRQLLFGSGGGGFLTDAERDEQAAHNAQREFDQNRTALTQELQGLRLTYDNQLFELCGASTDYARDCSSGLMEQNYLAMQTAIHRIVLARQRVDSIPEQIAIEQQRAGRVIRITIAAGQAQAADELAKGILNSVRFTQAELTSTADEWAIGQEARATTGGRLNIGLNFAQSGGYIEGSFSAYHGHRWSTTSTSSTSIVWDPAQQYLAEINSLQALRQAASEAEIIGANSDATIRNLLLQQADLLIELDIAIDEYNQLAAEHNALVGKYHNWLNLRSLAQNDLVDSYLTNPAYRIVRDAETIEASRSLGLAAQFAYLTTKALEYELLQPVPFMTDIFKARTADDIENYLNRLELWRVGLKGPGASNLFPYRISIAEDILGLSDENLDPNHLLTSSQIADKRLAEFQRFLQQHVITDTTTDITIAVEFPFATSLLDDRIFAHNIWNNRISGVGLPSDVAGVNGVSINISTRQTGDIGTPQVMLIHGGHATYRNVRNQVVTYSPGNARLSGYVVPPGFDKKSTTALILANVNGNTLGRPTSALFNLSVAASSWILRIDRTVSFNQNLDLSQLEDIEIVMDTTGIAIP